jgi:tellurite resistance protein
MCNFLLLTNNRLHSRLHSRAGPRKVQFINKPHHSAAPLTMTAPTPWLARLPIGLFAIPLGLLATSSLWRRAEQALPWAPAAAVAQAVGALALLVLVLLLVMLGLKAMRHGPVLRKELAHPVAGALAALMPLSVLMSVAVFGHGDSPLWLLLALGALALQGAIALPLAARVATGELQATGPVTPALYLPPVAGGLVGALALQALNLGGWAVLMFGMALAGWALLELRVLNRLFEGPLPLPLRPTIGIELAPAPVATLTAATLWPELPAEVLLLGLGIACGPLVAVLARWRWWTAVPFGAGFWSFSFPAAAFAGCVVEAVRRGHWPAMVSIVALVLATGVIAFLLLRTLQLLMAGRLLPPAA